MKLLIVSPLLYHAACGNGGGKICFELLRGLRANHEIALVAFSGSNAQDERAAVLALQPLCSYLKAVPLPRPGRLSNLLWRAGQWLGGAPVEAQVFNDPAMREAVRAAVEAFQPDVAMLQFPYMAQYAGQFGHTPVVMDVQDLFFVSRLRAVHAQAGRLARLKKTVAWLAWTRYERRWYQHCQLLMALTDEDRAALHALVPEVPAFTNAAVIAARQPPAPAVAPARSMRVGFGGQFGHPPNVEALAWMNDALAPALAERFPDLRIAIAGRGARQALAGTAHPALEWLGFVDDYDAFLHSCRVFLAPLRSGGGVKVKVLEALACGCPVVTTPIGAEGIALSADEGLMVTQGVDAMVEATATWLDHPQAAAAAGARGAAAMAERFGADAAVRRFEAAVQRMRPGPAAVPARAAPGGIPRTDAAALSDAVPTAPAAAPGGATGAALS